MNVIKNLKAKSCKDYTLKEMIIYVTIIFLMIFYAIGIVTSWLLSAFTGSVLLLFLAVFFGFLEIFPTAIYLYIKKDL